MKGLMPVAVHSGTKAEANLLMCKLADQDYQYHHEDWESYLLWRRWKTREVSLYE